MLSFFDPIRGMDYFSLVIRLLLAVLCGGLIGAERSVKNRTAGLRTHILVCLAGAVAAVTGHYLYLGLRISSDLTRMSSQVVAGLGFIGAGSILLTKNHAIKGLTTAAGLWAVGVIGIALGSGFYEAGLAATLLMLLTQTVFARVDRRIRANPKFSLELVYNDREALDEVMRRCARAGVALRDLRVESCPEEKGVYRARILLQGSELPEELPESLRGADGVLSVKVLP